MVCYCSVLSREMGCAALTWFHFLLRGSGHRTTILFSGTFLASSLKVECGPAGRVRSSLLRFRTWQSSAALTIQVGAGLGTLSRCHPWLPRRSGFTGWDFKCWINQLGVQRALKIHIWKLLCTLHKDIYICLVLKQTFASTSLSYLCFSLKWM